MDTGFRLLTISTVNKLLPSVILSMFLGIVIKPASAIQFNRVEVFPGSGIAFNFLNPEEASTLFVSAEVSPINETESGVFVSEYNLDGSLVRVVPISDPPNFQDGVEGLSFFDTDTDLFNLLFTGDTEIEDDATGTEMETSRVKEFETTNLTPVTGGVDFAVLGEGSEAEGVTYNPVRDTIFVTGELEEGTNGDETEIPFLVEFTRDGTLVNDFEIDSLTEFQGIDLEGLGFNQDNGSLLLVGNLEDETEMPGMETASSILYEISILADNSLDIIDEEFFDGEIEGVAFDHTTDTLFLAEEADAVNVPEPLGILGYGAVLGLGAFLRRMKQKTRVTTGA